MEKIIGKGRSQSVNKHFKLTQDICSLLRIGHPDARADIASGEVISGVQKLILKIDRKGGME